MKLPPRLIDYLRAKDILTRRSIILKCDDNRILTDFQMNGIESANQLGVIKLGKGTPIETITPFLEHTFFQTTEELLLPNIEPVPGLCLDVHIIPEDELWLVIVDKAEEAEELRKKIQRNNELEFERQLLQSKKKETGLRILSYLDFAVFKHIGPDRYALLNSPPVWLTNLLSISGYQKDDIDLASHFSYLESFFVEAAAFWESDKNGMIRSSLWTEIDSWGKEYYIQACALKLDSSHLILIEPRDFHVSEKQAIIQKAREKSLDFERVVKEEAALQKLVSLKDQFVMVVSHDLRTPVSAALGYFNLLLDDEDFINSNTEKHMKWLRVIYRQMENLIKYNEKVYNWINLELGNINLELVDTNLTEFVNRVIYDFIVRAKEKDIEFEYQFDDVIHVDIDETLFRNALYNLIGNAVKFSKPGDKIRIRVFKTGAHPMISIKDTGIGMKDDVKNELFSNYNTKHSKGTAGETGTGLGMGICKKILDAHGFAISVDSEFGKGTEFTIRL